MNISDVTPSSYSGFHHAGGNEKNESGEKTATTYSIAYNRVSKSEYDKYDQDGDGRISKKEEDEYKAEKKGIKTESENESENKDKSLLSSIGDNIDILA
jgi:hypothetical protein